DGSVKARGFYTVTRFVSWTRTSGSFKATGLIDAVGSADEAHAGVLTVRVQFWSHGSVVATGRMTITCALPGAPPGNEEGVTVIVHPVGTDIHITLQTTELIHLLGDLPAALDDCADLLATGDICGNLTGQYAEPFAGQMP